jgi:hypothetical protein
MYIYNNIKLHCTMCWLKLVIWFFCMEVHLRLFQHTSLSLKSHVYIHMECAFFWSLNFELDCFLDNTCLCYGLLFWQATNHFNTLKCKGILRMWRQLQIVFNEFTKNVPFIIKCVLHTLSLMYMTSCICKWNAY